MAQDPGRCGGVERMARPRGDRKPGHRGLSLAASAQPLPGRKFCRVLSAGASLAILLNRKPGSAGAGRWRRERRTPSPRAPAGTSEGEASEWTPRGAKAGPDGEGVAEPGGGVGVPQVVRPPHPRAPRACSRSHRAGRELRGPGRRPLRKDPTPAPRPPPPPGGRGRLRAAPHPKAGRAPAPTQALAPLWLASRGQWTQGTSWRQVCPRARGIHPVPRIPAFLFAPLRSGRSRGPGFQPTQPKTLRSAGGPGRGNSSPSFARPG